MEVPLLVARRAAARLACLAAFVAAVGDAAVISSD